MKLVGECAVGLVAVKPAATHEHTRTTADIAATRRVRSVRVSAAYADLSMGACGCSEQAGATHRVLGLIRRKRDAGSTIRFGRFRAIQPVAPAPIVSGMKRDRRSECAVAGSGLWDTAARKSAPNATPSSCLRAASARAPSTLLLSSARCRSRTAISWEADLICKVYISASSSWLRSAGPRLSSSFSRAL